MKIEDQLRRKLRQFGHKYNTEKSYVQRYNQFVQFIKVKYGKFRHPAELNKTDVEHFLTHLAVDRMLAPDTQRVALSALVFLYKGNIRIFSFIGLHYRCFFVHFLP